MWSWLLSYATQGPSSRKKPKLSQKFLGHTRYNDMQDLELGEKYLSGCNS